jgi:uncharacterized protein involved in outer membrane biogenesis
MAGGTVSITVDSNAQLVPVAQTVLCWAAADANKIRTYSGGPRLSIVIPEEVISGKGALNLRVGGADIVSGYVAGTHITVAAGNANPASGRTYAACAAKGAAGPQLSFAVAGRSVTATVNNGANGTVKINWGDGTAETTGVAQTGTSVHAYAWPGTYTVTVTDESSATDVATFAVAVKD